MCVGVVVAAVRLIVNIKLELWNSSSSIGSESFSAVEKTGYFTVSTMILSGKHLNSYDWILLRSGWRSSLSQERLGRSDHPV